MSKFRADEYTLHDFQENIAAVHTIPVKEAAYADFPENFPSILINFYRSKGIQSLY
jgi:hypothetical protein